MIEEITKYKTGDGQEYDSESKALEHIENTLGATVEKMLRDAGIYPPPNERYKIINALIGGENFANARKLQKLLNTFI